MYWSGVTKSMSGLRGVMASNNFRTLICGHTETEVYYIKKTSNFQRTPTLPVTDYRYGKSRRDIFNRDMKQEKHKEEETNQLIRKREPHDLN